MLKKKKKRSIGSGRRGEHWIFLKHKSYLRFEKRILGQLLCLTGSSTLLLIPVFTAALCGFLPPVPLVIWVGTEPGFCFPSLSCTFVSPATGSYKGKSSFFTHCFFLICSSSGVPFAGCCAQPSLCLELGLWFLVSFFFVFFFLVFWLPWSAQEAADSLWKTLQHSMQNTCFPVPCSFLLGVAEKTGPLGFHSFETQRAGLQLPTVFLASSPALWPYDYFHSFLIRNLFFIQLHKPTASSFPSSSYLPKLPGHLIILSSTPSLLWFPLTTCSFFSLVLKGLAAEPQMFQHLVVSGFVFA